MASTKYIIHSMKTYESRKRQGDMYEVTEREVEGREGRSGRGGEGEREGER